MSISLISGINHPPTPRRVKYMESQNNLEFNENIIYKN
jgi:hypothetical protein